MFFIKGPGDAIEGTREAPLRAGPRLLPQLLPASRELPPSHGTGGK